jgi:hypothetical protein
MLLAWYHKACGQYGDQIMHACAIPYDDLMLSETDVFHA